MLPELITIGPLVIHTYGLMVALGILAGVGLAEYMHRKSGGEPGRVLDMALVVILSGLLGARALFVAINWSYYSGNPLEILMMWKGGLVFYGGLFGGIAAYVACIRFYGLSLWPMLDIGAAAISIGHAMGRMGCFTAGCCYGQGTDLPWAVTFTDPRCLATEILGEPVHPTQLYSFLFLGGLTAFLVWLQPRKRFQGQLACSYLILYGLFRFVVEFFRGDPRGTYTLGPATLTTSQWVSVLAVTAGTMIFVTLRRRAAQVNGIKGSE